MELPESSSTLLKAALLQRAKEAITWNYIINESKNRAKRLIQKGCIPQITYKKLLEAGEQLNAEAKDIVAEARGLGGDEWAKNILGQAYNYYHKHVVMQKLIQAQLFGEIEKSDWEEQGNILKGLGSSQGQPGETIS